jgi:hypothetical protein
MITGASHSMSTRTLCWTRCRRPRQPPCVRPVATTTGSRACACQARATCCRPPITERALYSRPGRARRTHLTYPCRCVSDEQRARLPLARPQPPAGTRPFLERRRRPGSGRLPRPLLSILQTTLDSFVAAGCAPRGLPPHLLLPLPAHAALPEPYYAWTSPVQAGPLSHPVAAALPPPSAAARGAPPRLGPRARRCQPLPTPGAASPAFSAQQREILPRAPAPSVSAPLRAPLNPSYGPHCQWRRVLPPRCRGPAFPTSLVLVPPCRAMRAARLPPPSPQLPPTLQDKSSERPRLRPPVRSGAAAPALIPLRRAPLSLSPPNARRCHQGLRPHV